MSKILIKGGTVVARGSSYQADVLVSDGIIANIASTIDAEADTEVFDASGAIVTYGLADVHTHMREPGFSEKETFATGTAAAAHGGVTTILTMPNLNPAPDSVEGITVQQQMIDKGAIIEVRPMATITKNREGVEIADIEALAPLCVAYSDDG